MDKDTHTNSFETDSLDPAEISANYYLFRIFSTIFFCFPLKQKSKTNFENGHWLGTLVENSEVSKRKKKDLSFKKVVIETQLMNKMSRDWSEIIRQKKKEKEKLIDEEKKQKYLLSKEPEVNKIKEDLEMDNLSDTESINIDELVTSFIENTRKQQTTIDQNSDENVDVNYSQNTCKILEKPKKYPSDKIHKKRTMDEYFQQKLITDLIKKSNDKKNGKKKETYHSRLLLRGLDSGINGKMVKYTDYHAYNSDDSSDVSETFESSLFYRYGMASRFVDDTLKQDLITGNAKGKQKNKRNKETKHLKARLKRASTLSCNDTLNR